MNKQDALKPVDIAIVLALGVRPGDSVPTYSVLAAALGVSASTAHESVRRLQRSGLLLPESLQPNVTLLLNFLEYGIRCAFPPSLGRVVRGVPTAHAGPALAQLFDATDPVVWPDLDGSIRGTGLTPLYPNATALPGHEPEIYDALTLVDALRVGQARERAAALAALRQALAAET